MSATACPWEYKMVQVPPTIQAGRKAMATAAARYLESEVNKAADDGWEFFRVDTIGVEQTPGCIGALLGQKNSRVEYYVITFRRPFSDS